MKLSFDIFAKAVCKFSYAAFDSVQWLSRYKRKEDNIRKLDENRITIRGK